jgi:Rrf2 family protein
MGYISKQITYLADMKFTKKTDYALRTMEFLARLHFQAEVVGNGKPTPVPVQTISDQLRLSLRFLQGVVSLLSKAKLLKTLPGVKGGITLAGNPEKITLLSIIEAVEGKINLMGCLDHPETCGDFPQCSIMNVLQSAQAALISSLSNTNLKLMVKAKRDPFNRLPQQHFLKPQFGCPVLK